MMVKKNIKLLSVFCLFVSVVFFVNFFVSAETGLSTNSVYDSNGNVVFKEINEDSVKFGTRYSYDSFNRVTSIRSLDKEIKFSYFGTDSQPVSESVFDMILNNSMVLNFSYSNGNKIVQDFQENGLTYIYNSQGVLTEFSLGNYVYNFNTDQYGNVAFSCLTSYFDNSSSCTGYSLVYNGNKLVHDDTFSYEYSSDGKLEKKILEGDYSERYFYSDSGEVVKKVVTDLASDYSTIYYTLIPGDESSFVSIYDLSQIVLANNHNSCEDSDLSETNFQNSLFSLGYVFYNGVSKYDTCLDANHVREYYCGRNILFFGNFVEKSGVSNCPYGCSNGACLQQSFVETKNCSQKNGNICLSNQTCSIEFVNSSDSTRCCFETCKDVLDLPPEPIKLG